MEKDSWKKKLAEVLKEHEEIDSKTTGRVEVHLNEGGVTKIYIYKELK